MPFVSSSTNHLPSTQPLHSSRPRAMQASAPAPPVPNAIPSIRLISATPSSTVISSSDGGKSSTSSASFARALEDSWDAAAAAKASNASLALAPKVLKTQENVVETTGKKRLVPKKSKLGIFSSTPFTSSSASANTDFSDVVRRIGAPAPSSASSLKAKGGFEIYVDPTDDPDIGEILVVRKRPSRVRGGLGGVGWGVEVGGDAPPPMPQVMGEKTNLGLGKVDEKEGKEKERWWTIGRGRKDSKDEKEKKKGKENFKMSASLKPVEYIHEAQPARSVRSRTPDLLASTFKLSPITTQTPTQDTRARFNSLDSGLLLSQPHVQVNANSNTNNTSSVRMRGASTSAVSTLMGSAAPVSTNANTNTGAGGLLAPPSSTSGGFLAPPPTSGASASQGQGSIALRAMRSVRSLARMGSWAQFSGAMEEDGRGSKDNGMAKDKAKKKSDGTVGKKEGKEKKTKNKKTEDPESRGDDAKKSKSKKSSKSKSSKLKDSVQAPEASTPRLSTSSFEVGALSASPGPMAARALGESTSSYSSAGAGSGAYLGVGGVAQKKRSILGLGLPSTIRLPTVRSGSTASSVLVGGANAVGPSFGAPPSAATAAAAFSVSGNNNNPATNDNRLSVDSALNNPATTSRPSSVLSNASSAGSSLRPISTTSTDSRLSRTSSVGSSVRWDEEGLETIRERRGKERAAGAAEEKEKADRRTSKESKHSLEGRKRGSLASLFPDSRRGSYASSEGAREEKGGGRMGGYPIVTIEEATVDGHGSLDDDDRMLVDEESGHRGFGDSEDRMDVDVDHDGAPGPTETPVKQQKVRTRPVSEQLLKGSRPKAVYEDDEGVISILDAATNDLAMLINILDLQATPGNTPNATPLKASPSVAGSSVMSSAVSSVVSSIAKSDMAAGEGPTPTGVASTKTTAATRGGVQQRRVADSPLKKTLRPTGSSSISSLRPYAQSRGYSGSNSNDNNNAVNKATAKTNDPNPTNANTVTVNNATAANNAAASLIAKQIAPWSALIQGLSPVKEKSPSSSTARGRSSASPSATMTRRGVKKITPPPSTSTSASFSPSSVYSLSPPQSISSSFKRGHKRTMTPAPEPEPEVAFQPLGLRPERVRARGGVMVAQGRLVQLSASGSQVLGGEKERDGDAARVPSCLTFGSASGSASAEEHREGAEEEEGRSLTPVFKRMQAQELESGSWGRTRAAPPPSVFSLSLGVPGSAGGRSMRSTFSFEVEGMDEFVEGEGEFVGEGEDDEALLPDAQHTRRRILGMSGTLGGGSDSSAYHPDAPLDVDDEDSDVPGELREILKEHENELRHERSMVEIPVFRASLTDHSDYPEKTTMGPSPSPFPSPAPSSHSLSLPSPTTTSEDDTKQSFDFTGELRKLNESGASDRRSFVEQLENAFRTPARVDLRYGFEVPPSQPPPPLPDMPLGVMKLGGAFELSGGATSGDSSDRDGEAFDDGVSRIVDVQLPSWSSASAEVTNPNEAHLDTNPADSDSLQLGALGQSKSRSRLVDVQEPSGLLSASTSSSNSSSSTRPSDGELDRSFRFGGLPKASAAQQEKEKAPERELTLSDIIPPPAHARSISLASGALDSSTSRHGQHQTTASDPSADLDSEALEDDSVLKSIYAKILEGLPPAVPRPKRVDPGVANSGVAKVSNPDLVSEEKENKAQPIKTQPLAIAKAKKPTTTTALNQNVHERRKSVYKGPSASRPASGISFEGFTSFEEVRRGFEFSGERPGFYPPPPPVPAIPSNVDSFSFGSSGNASYSFVPSSSSAASYNPNAARRAAAPHKRHESAFSIASVSSYGHVINPGSTDPFDYGALLMPSLQERPVSEDEEDGMSLRSVSMSMSVDDTFAFVAEQQRLHGGGGAGVGVRGWRVRQRVESDASSFYFRPGGGAGGHRRRESNMSVSSQVPPVSMYNRSGQSSHGHSRNDSSASSSSVAISYARYGANSGFGAWAASRYHQQHRREMSVDGDGDDNMSVMSEGGRDFEAMRRERVGMGRPGVGEKMFGSPGDDEETEEGLAPPPFGLTRIDASPLGVEFDQEGTYDYYDSILDGSDEPRRASVGSAGSRESRSGDNEYEDSIFEKTGYRSSMEVDGDDESSVFGRKVGGQQQQQQQGRGLFPPANASSRLSMMSNQSLSVGGLSDGNVREDDTMISMLGGGHVRRRSVGSIIEASPCVRVRGVVKKRKRAVLPSTVKAPTPNPYDSGSELENPRGFEYDAYNRSSLAEELGVVELNKGFATHRPRMSFDSAASTDQGFGGYDDDYAPDSLHRNKSARVSAVDANVNVNGNFKSPVSVPVRPAIASASTSTLASAFHFGGERMIRAQTGLLVGRPSLEEGCLTADGDGEDVGMSVSMGGLHRPTPVFSRPSAPTSHMSGRSRSSTCTSASGGDTTPPLSAASDGSSISGGSQSSIDLDSADIDLARVNAAFGALGGSMNATHPMVTASSSSSMTMRAQQHAAQQRARARGTGHRRRYSKGGGASVSAHMSRSSVYETIEEEAGGLGSSTNSKLSTASADAADAHTVSMSPPFHAPASSEFGSTTKLGKVGGSVNDNSPTIHQPVYIVDADTAALQQQHHQHRRSSGSHDYDFGVWDDERGIVALRKYYALKDEAQTTVSESRRVWLDTPFSLFAIQSFQAPEEPSGMQALLEHSVQTYGPLPSDLRPRRRVRSRTSSRASPYPQTRVSNGNFNSNANANSNFGDFNPNFNSNFNISNSSSLSPPSFVHADPYATANTPKSALTTPVLREVAVNSNLARGSAPSIEALKPFSPLVLEGVVGLGSAVKVKANANNNANNNTIRPPVGSTARRTALGWSKRSTGPGAVGNGNGNVGGKKSSTTMSTDQKENSIVVMGSGSGSVMMTPGDNLRLNRPRPKGRPTPGGRSGGGATPGSQLRPRSGIRV